MQTVPHNQVKEEDKIPDGRQVFVTNVDPDVSHWQTKETEFFTIKFPKEWYWLELDREKSEYRNMYVISNNLGFPLEDYKNDPIGMAGIDERTTLQNSEVVITFGGTATTNSGTPLDSLDFLIATSQNNSTRKCIRPSDTKTIPLIASCVSQEGNQKLQVYYIISETTSLYVRMHTSLDTLASKDIFEKIAYNIETKP